MNEEAEDTVRKTIYISKEQDKALRMHRALHEVTYSEATRIALDEYLKKFDDLKEYIK